jgi:hypothetical protein
MLGPTLDPDVHGVVDDNRRWWPATANSFTAATLIEAKTSRAAVAAPHIQYAAVVRSRHSPPLGTAGT